MDVWKLSQNPSNLTKLQPCHWNLLGYHASAWGFFPSFSFSSCLFSQFNFGEKKIHLSSWPWHNQSCTTNPDGSRLEAMPNLLIYLSHCFPAFLFCYFLHSTPDPDVLSISKSPGRFAEEKPRWDKAIGANFGGSGVQMGVTLFYPMPGALESCSVLQERQKWPNNKGSSTGKKKQRTFVWVEIVTGMERRLR